MKRRLFLLAPLIATILVLLSSLVNVLPIGSSTVYAANNADAACRKILVAGTGASPSDVKSDTVGFSDCKNGYNIAYSNPTQTNPAKPTGPCDLSISSIKSTSCEAGFKQGLVDARSSSGTQQTAAQIKAAAEKACKPWKVQSGVSSSDQTKNFNACVAGYIGQKSNPPKTQSEACGGYSGFQQRACYTGFGGAANGQAINPGAGGAGTVTSSTVSTQSSGDTNDKQLGCEFNANPLSWIICPVIDTLVAIVSAIDNMITQQMTVDTNKIFCSDGATCKDYYQAWKSFRNIALGLMVIAGLVVVIAQALGVEILDAYTLRKTLPRILIAAIGITLSWPLMEFFVNLTNDLGFGIRHLIYAPFKDLSDTIQFGQSAGEIFFGGAVGGTLASASVGGAAAGAVLFTLSGGIGAMLAYVGTAALAVFIAIIVLALRQVAIIMLMLLAPIAIVSYILPNTQKIYQFWWDAFSKALLMFPLIAAFIASGRIFSAIAINSGGALNQIIGFFAYFAPYFLIPLTFKFAGGFVRQLGGFVNDRSKGGFDRLRQFRSNRRKSGFQRIQSGNMYRGAEKGSRKYDANKAWQAISNFNPDRVSSINPRTWRSEARAFRAEADIRNARKYLESDKWRPILGDDDAGEALMHGKGDLAKTKQFLIDSKGYSEADAEAKMGFLRPILADGEMGLDSLMQAAFMSTSMASTAWLKDESRPGMMANARMLEDLEDIAGGNPQLRAVLTGAVKENAKQRPDLAAAPFAETYGGAKEIGDIKANTSLTTQQKRVAINEVGRRLGKKLLNTEGINALLSGKASATEALAPLMMEIIDDHVQTLEVADTRIEQFLDVIQGTLPPEKRAELARLPQDKAEQEIQKLMLENQNLQVNVDDGTGTGRTITLNGRDILQGRQDADTQLTEWVAQAKGAQAYLGQMSHEKAAVVSKDVLLQPMKLQGFNGTVLDYAMSKLDDPVFFAVTNDIRSRYGQALSPEQQKQMEADLRARSTMGIPPVIPPPGS